MSMGLPPGLLAGAATDNSGVTSSDVTLTGGKVRLLAARRAPDDGPGAMATLQVHVTDAQDQPAIVGNPDQRLVMDLQWRRGRGGGEVTVDVARGSVISISAADSIDAWVRMVGTVAGRSKRVAAAVSFGGSGAPLPAFLTSDPIVLGAGATSAKVQIPLFARGLIVLSTAPASLPTLTASFFRDNAAGAPGAWSTSNPNANGTPIVSGAEFVSFTTVDAMTLTPVWELWL